jgi:hypothetical protein
MAALGSSGCWGMLAVVVDGAPSLLDWVIMDVP